MDEKQLTNAEKARCIVTQTSGHEGECLDWLDDGDGDSMNLDELIQEWLEIGCTYSA